MKSIGKIILLMMMIVMVVAIMAIMIMILLSFINWSLLNVNSFLKVFMVTV